MRAPRRDDSPATPAGSWPELGLAHLGTPIALTAGEPQPIVYSRRGGVSTPKGETPMYYERPLQIWIARKHDEGIEVPIPAASVARVLAREGWEIERLAPSRFLRSHRGLIEAIDAYLLEEFGEHIPDRAGDPEAADLFELNAKAKAELEALE
jgi:hypothetical protein